MTFLHNSWFSFRYGVIDMSPGSVNVVVEGKR